MTRIGAFSLIGREAIVRDWVRRKLGSVDHELRVAHLAGLLFDLTQKRHGLGAGERRLLMLGALTHDVGRAVADEGHEQIGARMLTENGTLPLSETERRRVAYLTRYHKGRVPAMRQDEILRHEADADDARTMGMLLGLLRAADGLDSRSVVPPRLFITMKGTRLTIQGFVAGSVGPVASKLGKAKKFRLMEEMLGCEVRALWFGKEMAAMVA
jgi:exopolyphosphatase/pppGpp-phosphohydrolase